MDYPLHLGVTEAGDANTPDQSLGIGTLLAEGIGDDPRLAGGGPVNELPSATDPPGSLHAGRSSPAPAAAGRSSTAHRAQRGRDRHLVA
jgi:hypothetical protein